MTRQISASAEESSPYMLTLEQKIDPAHTALVVIDFQNDFVAEGGVFDRTGATIGDCRAIAPSLRTILSEARTAGVPVIFVQSIYSTDDKRYLSRVMLHQTWRTQNGRYHKVPLCEPGTWGADFYEDVRPQPGEPVVVKHRFDAFFRTDLDLILRSRGIETVVTTGVMTDTCVESTVRDAYFRDYFVVVPRECVGAQTVERQMGALERFDRLYGEVVSLEDVTRVWRQSASAGQRGGSAVGLRKG